LPRFPDRDSFPMAKDLIDRFHEDDLDYRDLRIALFWLGFGLLEMPTRERPTMSLVPLCKDLASYEDTAVELGYSPSASVHARPVCLHQDSDALGVCAAAAGPSSSSSSTAGSSSSSAEACSTAALGAEAPAASSTGPVPQPSLQEESIPEGTDLWHTDCDDDYNNEDDTWLGSEGIQAKVVGGCRGVCGSSPSSYCEVKLLHAGGWSSSSGSEGNRTPPTPVTASSSTGGTATAEAGGLTPNHVGQFTVTFVSDLQLHEELEETSCLCTFCLDEMKVGEELCRLPCMHTFHRRCVYAWLERDRRCMLCRLDVTRPCG